MQNPARPVRRKLPQQARSEVTVANILEATLQLAESEGFQRLTTPQIAKKAGVSVGSLYQYFSSCESIYLALYEKVSSECAAIVRKDMLNIINEPPESGVKILAARVLTLYEKHSLILLKLAQDVPGLRGHMNTLMSFDGLIRASVKTYMQLHLGAGAKSQFESQLFLMESAIVHALQRYALEKPPLVRRGKFINDIVSLVTGYLQREASRGRIAGK